MNRDQLTARQLRAVVLLEQLAAHTANLRQLHERAEHDARTERDALWLAHLRAGDDSTSR